MSTKTIEKLSFAANLLAIIALVLEVCLPPHWVIRTLFLAAFTFRLIMQIVSYIWSKRNND